MEDFFIKCDQIRRKLRIWSHLLKKSLMENFIFCAVISSILQKLSDDDDNLDAVKIRVYTRISYQIGL